MKRLFICNLKQLLGASLILIAMESAYEAKAQAIIPPSITAGFQNTANSTSPLSSNLSEVTDYSSEYPFVNHFKMARRWFSAPGDWSGWEDSRSLSLDANGNVKSLLTNQFARTVLFTGRADPSIAGAVFHVYYDGDGDLAYENVAILSRSKGFDIIKLNAITSADSELTAIITLTRTNAANPLRNIRFLPPGGICASNPLKKVANPLACSLNDYKSFQAYHDKILFNPTFLDSIKKYKALRFMNWMRTNNSKESAFPTRALPSHQFWSTEKGVPLEVMTALANLIDADPWFSIPHLATDSYVNSFFQLENAQLELGRRAYVEYSNEVWNSLFDQSLYAKNMGIQLGINYLGSTRDDFAGLLHYYSRRSRQILTLARNAMPGLGRLRRVMAGQAANPWVTTEILNFENGASVTDAFAIAPYFGDTIVDKAKRDELIRLGVNGIFQWLSYDNNSILNYGSLPSINRVIRDQSAILKLKNIPLIAYEGGQHFLAAGSFQWDAQLNSLFDMVNRDTRMKSIYLSYLQNWRNVSRDQFFHFVNCDKWSEYGRWGSKEYALQPITSAPKYDGLMTFITNNPTQ